MTRSLLLPGDPGFFEILYSNTPPGTTLTNTFFADFKTGLLRQATDESDLENYLLGGEYQAVMEAYGDGEEPVFYEEISEEEWFSLEL